MQKKRLRAVLLYSSGHLGSTIIFNILRHAPEIEFVGVMRSKPIPVSRKGKSVLAQHLKKIGWKFAFTLFFQWVALRLAFIFSRFLPLSENPLLPCKEIAKKMDIATFECLNINTPEAADFIRQQKPDIIISSYFSQLIDPQIIKIPKHGILNIHPGWLPAYRGALSYFWVLKNGEDEAGVSIHWMDEGIDTGELIAREKFNIHQGATQQQVMVETAKIGAKLVHHAIKELAEGRDLVPVMFAEDEKDGYYSMPTQHDFREYFKKRKEFFRFCDTFRVILEGVKDKAQSSLAKKAEI
ncbi:MAG: hypothetical protein COV36_05610 [Alphaproteobacteria bacterium CG11_big_fil_rev_8_21_14_0_20_44_7]|nr:MAG: hypothetical protein COV36_05610 [Alphaproteobacteria bacterium CG11_big_fil_rev_8_21_14_0_20_44_7]